jgi:cytochrome c6
VYDQTGAVVGYTCKLRRFAYDGFCECLDCGFGGWHFRRRREIQFTRQAHHRMVCRPKIQGVFLMKSFRSLATLAALVAFAGVLSFAQDGAATYKSKCAMCHGPTGTPSEGMAKAMGIKPASDPSMKALSVDQISAAVKSGKGKMKPVAGLSDSDIKSVSEYFKSLK